VLDDAYFVEYFETPTVAQLSIIACFAERRRPPHNTKLHVSDGCVRNDDTYGAYFSPHGFALTGLTVIFHVNLLCGLIAP